MNRSVRISASILFLTATWGQPTWATASDPVTAVADFASELVQLYIHVEQDLDTQHALAIKNAIVSINADLIHMATLKQNMAKSAVCLGQNEGKMDQDSKDSFRRCSRNFEADNRALVHYVYTMKDNIKIVDPNWVSSHSNLATELDQLYYQKLSMNQKALDFYQNSERGGLFHHYLVVNPDKCEVLADALYKESKSLSMAEKPLGDALKAQGQ